MISALIRRDPDLRHLRWLLPVAALLGVWLGWVFRLYLQELPNYEHSGMTPPAVPIGMMLVGALSLGLYGSLLAIRSQKVSDLGMQLPVTAKQLVLARVLVLHLCFATPLFVYVIVAGIFLADALWIGRLALGSVALILAFSFATLSVHAQSPREQLSQRSPVVWLFLFVLIAAPFLPLALWTDFDLFTDCFLYLTWTGLAFSLWRGLVSQLPPGLRLHESVRAADSLRPPVRQPLRRLLLGHVLLRPSAIFALLFLMLMLLLFTGTHGRVQRSGFLLMPIFWLLLPVASNTGVLSRLGALPVARRRVFPWIVLPSLIAAALGVILAVLLRSSFPPTAMMDAGTVQLQYQHYSGGSTQEPVPPPAYWRRAEIPPSPAESAPPTRTVFGKPSVYFNPYHVPADAGEEFGAAQLQRALDEVHGIEINKHRALELWRRERPLTAQRALAPPFTARLAPARIFLATAQWSLLAWLALPLALIGSFPAASRRAARRRIGTAVALVTLLTAASIAILLIEQVWFGSEAVWAAFFVEDYLARHPLVLGAGTFLLVVAWRLCWRRNLRRFEGMEVRPPHKSSDSENS